MLDTTPSEPTRIWVRNPAYCVRECIEASLFDYIWDIGYTVKYSIDPVKFAEVWLGGLPWKLLTVSDEDDICIERDHTGSVRTHDVWSYGDDLKDLERMLSENAGTDRMVVIMRLPSLRFTTGLDFIRLLGGVQDDYPNSTMHIHAQYSWYAMFAPNFGSVDIEPRFPARQGQLHLPNGMRRSYQDISDVIEWVNVLGMTGRDLKVPRNRCIYNLRSAKWAAAHFKEIPDIAVGFRQKPRTKGEPKKRRPFFRYVRPEGGDKLTCDTCSLANSCRYYRPGAICAVPDSDVADFSEYFNTRDADAIVEGLGELLASQMQRLQTGMEAEEEAESKKLSREVTSLFDKVFKNGVALAKLVDPTLAKPAVQVSISSGAPALPETMSKQALMAAVVGELEARGIERADITPEMVSTLLAERAEQAALNRAT